MTTFTAKQFNKNPASVYRAADKGDVVRLNHDRYPDKIFELTARDRAPLDAQKQHNESSRKFVDEMETAPTRKYDHKWEGDYED